MSQAEVVVSARPWGTFEVIEAGDGYQVKRLEVLPGKRLSYQTHRFRSEHWFLVAGSGVAVLDGERVAVEAGGSVDVPVGVAHRIENTGETPLVLIEVQRGSYLGEDDIVRIEDDFGRADEGTTAAG